MGSPDSSEASSRPYSAADLPAVDAALAELRPERELASVAGVARAELGEYDLASLDSRLASLTEGIPALPAWEPPPPPVVTRPDVTRSDVAPPPSAEEGSWASEPPPASEAETDAPATDAPSDGAAEPAPLDISVSLPPDAGALSLAPEAFGAGEGEVPPAAAIPAEAMEGEAPRLDMGPDSAAEEAAAEGGGAAPTLELAIALEPDAEEALDVPAAPTLDLGTTPSTPPAAEAEEEARVSAPPLELDVGEFESAPSEDPAPEDDPGRASVDNILEALAEDERLEGAAEQGESSAADLPPAEQGEDSEGPLVLDLEDGNDDFAVAGEQDVVAAAAAAAFAEEPVAEPEVVVPAAPTSPGEDALVDAALDAAIDAAIADAASEDAAIDAAIAIAEAQQAAVEVAPEIGEAGLTIDVEDEDDALDALLADVDEPELTSESNLPPPVDPALSGEGVIPSFDDDDEDAAAEATMMTSGADLMAMMAAAEAEALASGSVPPPAPTGPPPSPPTGAPPPPPGALDPLAAAFGDDDDELSIEDDMLELDADDLELVIDEDDPVEETLTISADAIEASAGAFDDFESDAEPAADGAYDFTAPPSGGSDGGPVDDSAFEAPKPDEDESEEKKGFFKKLFG